MIAQSVPNRTPTEICFNNDDIHAYGPPAQVLLVGMNQVAHFTRAGSVRHSRSAFLETNQMVVHKPGSPKQTEESS